METKSINTSTSFVIPVYKTPETLFRACLKSVLAATCSCNGEILLVIDSPNDPIETVANQYAAANPCIKIIRNDRNRGPAYSRNRGIDAAKNDFIITVDSDDEIVPEICMKAIRACAEQELDICSIARVNPWCPETADNQRTGNLIYGGAIQAKSPYFGRALSTIDMSSSGVIYRRSFLENKKIRYNESLHQNEDFVFMAHAVSSGAIIGVWDEIGYIVSFRGDSLSHRRGGEHSSDMALAAIDIMRLPGLSGADLDIKLFYARKAFWQIFCAQCPPKTFHIAATEFAKTYACALSPIARLAIYIALKLPARVTIRQRIIRGCFKVLDRLHIFYCKVV